jgi:hypothetical protein
MAKHGKKRRDKKHSGFAQHIRNGSKLLTRLSQLGINTFDWERDVLPEYLWLAALLDDTSESSVHRYYYEFMDAFDKFWPLTSVALGLISDFGVISEEKRQEFLTKHLNLVSELFHRPIGRILAFYPECPAAWLVRHDIIEKEGALDPQVEMGRLRRLVVKLIPGKDDFAGHVRILPVGRLVNSGKLHFSRVPSIMEAVELMKKYPDGCSSEEKSRVQQFGRCIINMDVQHEERFKTHGWPRYFWQHNYDLAVCQPRLIPVRGTKPVDENQMPALVEALEHNANACRDYVAGLAMRTRCDLYAPEKGEVLSGLFARTVRLFTLMCEDPGLWARDTGGILLRCLADTAITFSYLAKSGTDRDFADFRSYGEGQEKLLMLHLQDNYPTDTSLEGRTAETIANEMGYFTPELTNIELGHWTKKDTRKLAQEAGMERLYRLVYTPTSSDVHGTWVSVKSSNLCHCAEPLHRFHRLPAYIEPPLYVNVMTTAQELVEHCFKIGEVHLGVQSLRVEWRG